MYGTPKALEQAIKAAAKNAVAAGRKSSVGDLMRQAYYDRFLCRIFTPDAVARFVLKGGTGMLARIPDARATRDVDLMREGDAENLEEALESLKMLASKDLDDWLEFNFAGKESILGGGQQEQVSGYEVRFDVLLGGRIKDRLSVDLSVTKTLAGPADTLEPESRLILSKPLIAHPYRLYPLTAQVADKVCATMTLYGGQPSSRAKDIVDLVIIANTQPVERRSLSNAIDFTRRSRGLEFTALLVPEAMKAAYESQARKIGSCQRHQKFDEALRLLDRFITDALEPKAENARWDHENLGWVTA